MSEKENTRTLDSIPVLASLPAAARRALEKTVRWREYAAQELIIDRASDTNDVYFIVSGRVRVVNFSYAGREVSYDEIGAGTVFGELAAIDGAPRSATVVALGKTTTAALPPKEFVRLIKENPDFALSIMKRLVEIVRGSTARIMDLSTLGAPGRIYAELLRMAVVSETDASARIEPVPVHADIASRVGSTRESVTRAISELTRRGLIEREGDALVIADVEQLHDLIEGV